MTFFFCRFASCFLLCKTSVLSIFFYLMFRKALRLLLDTACGVFSIIKSVQFRIMPNVPVLLSTSGRSLSIFTSAQCLFITTLLPFDMVPIPSY